MTNEVDAVAEEFKNFELVRRTTRRYGSAATYKLVGCCQSCNTGWMRRLEEEVAPIMRPMFQARRVLLDAGAQTILSRWVTKLAVAFDAYEPQQRRQRRLQASVGTKLFHELQRPSDGSLVRIGCLSAYPDKTEGIPHGTTTIHCKQTDGTFSGEEAYRFTFAFGQLIVQTIIMNPPTSDNWLANYYAVIPDNHPLIQCWPILEESLIWPPNPRVRPEHFKLIW